LQDARISLQNYGFKESEVEAGADIFCVYGKRGSGANAMKRKGAIRGMPGLCVLRVFKGAGVSHRVFFRSSLCCRQENAWLAFVYAAHV